MFSKIKKTIQAVQLFFLMRKFKGMVMCSDKYIQELADKIGYGAQLALEEYVQEKLGRPICSNEWGDQRFHEIIQAMVAEDFLMLCE